MDKSELRARLTDDRRALRDSLTPDQRRRWDDLVAAAAMAKLAELGVNANAVASYESLPTEPPTVALNSALSAGGTRVWLPEYRDPAGTELAELMWRSTSPGVTERASLPRVDAVFVPALAATSHGERLGKGKGYYDKLLRRLSLDAAPPPPTIALVRASELLEWLPTEPHDFPVDHVLTVADPD